VTRYVAMYLEGGGGKGTFQTVQFERPPIMVF